MKLPLKLFILYIAVFLITLVNNIDAKVKRRNKNRCKYKQNGEDGDCDQETNTKMVFLKLKGRRSDPSCASIKAVTKPCNNYTISKKYKRDQVKKARCVFDKSVWSGCDPDTNTMTREMKLVSGDITQCQRNRLVTKPCGNLCRYLKGGWSSCNPESKTMQRHRIPKPGSAIHCKPDTQTRRCQPSVIANKNTKCKYSPGKWSPCDKRTNTQTQLMSLKNGDPNICLRSKKLARKCKIACKFRQGEWSECDQKTDLSTRIDQLVKGNVRECALTRQIHKKCRKACKYSHGVWDDCDPETNSRTRRRKLIKGDGNICKEEEVVSKPCTKRDGKDACFYGSWGDFGPCTNGVRMKYRTTISGSLECEKKAVATEACDQNKHSS